jgi:predicted transcriptional regulator
MKNILIEIDDATAHRLERIAPARSRRRSEFIREAIRKALWAIEERETAEAYRRQPDAEAEASFDPAVWEAPRRRRSPRRGRR